MKRKIIFTITAEALEGASGAMLLGDFNNWDPQHAPSLQQQVDGNFATTIELEAGNTYQYRFLLNDGRWVNDYHAQYYTPVPGLHIDNSVITVSEEMGDSEEVMPATEVKQVKTKTGAAKKPAKKASAKKVGTQPAKKAAASKSTGAKSAGKTTVSKAKTSAAPKKTTDAKLNKQAGE